MAWWGRLNPRFRDYAERFVVRWSDPDGRVVQEKPVEEFGGIRIGSVLKLDADPTPGTWTAELLLHGERVERFRVPVEPRGG
jgi:hypothetical protein